ncbi:Uncharacterised protein [Niallia circulans]|jgi:hypothetical protein|nr:hypothetical protein [Niallia circulans]MED3839877.1 hypothetical protein [Niallia circulans]MED4241363.1 hypothetical protein [Niallia circulans]MED4248024.1 hypothetical protein [Niallia circulans]MED5103399.1 hypothetical protein [Niallia circulans]SPU11140.1 Uncharacterised protein [Niallia circulans]
MQFLRIAMIVFSSLTAASLFGFQFVEMAHAIMDSMFSKQN